MIWLYIALVISWVIAAVACFVAWRFLKRAGQYDIVFQYLAEDIVTNLRQFGKMANNNVLMNDHEVQQAHRNMMVMGQRLNEILTQIDEVSGLTIRPPPPPPRPKVQ